MNERLSEIKVLKRMDGVRYEPLFADILINVEILLQIRQCS